MIILEVNKNLNHYSLILDSTYGLMLESDSGEAMGISEEDLFELLKKFFEEKY